MKRARLPGMGWLGVTLGLFVACSGKVQSLGETAGIGGKGAQYLSGGTGNVATGGATAGPATGGYTAGPATGGATYQGGATSMGGMGLRTGGYAYMVEPTLPIDPNCTCSSPAQICNAARECVPRCDRFGFCAMWLTNRAVKDLYVEGSTLYFATSAVVDPLGNVGTNGALYRVEYPNGTPTLIAGGLEDPSKILGRYAGATFLQTGVGTSQVVRVTDRGVITMLDNNISQTATMRGKWIAYTSTDLLSLRSIDLEGNLTPQVLADVTQAPDYTVGQAQTYLPNSQVLDDYIWYGKYVKTVFHSCYLNPTDLALGSTCSIGMSLDYSHCTSGGNQLFCDGVAREFTGKKLLTIFSDGSFSDRDKSCYSEGWVYSTVAEISTRLVRYPTTLGRMPQEVLPADVATTAFYYYFTSAASAAAGSYGFAVGSPGIFWFQAVQDKSKGQYIFHAPLPAQPCDADLPCADTTEVCTNGLCSAP